MELLQANTGKGRRRIGLGWVEGEGHHHRPGSVHLAGNKFQEGERGWADKEGVRRRRRREEAAFVHNVLLQHVPSFGCTEGQLFYSLLLYRRMLGI